uniref:Large ribosomal subunit protein uL23c n=1 Tax=Undaria pinnatifida TaxID=74381 RepID=A0A0R6LUV2_UNDPI|nr:50S ribosomal protein L23 [Undaria pinnatifida]YP_011002458.1 50S ribosomal protein L23 [Undaria peterseniana]AKG49997.1 50S ribosomal protein L23 [Undaria pinnatifida]AMM05467.1 ribosomal protein L23 [Undaria pinnatifida]UXC96908.1 50S ribosomal protein L23 [Undaria pinnatifida]UXC97046.1 50S ribosomal protein L23 [Undaria pinnatifida]UXC97184.1 50S ribosomal protein L23 [Undaria pinnatifida]
MARIKFSSSIDLIKYPVTTIKTNLLLENNQYTFLVDPKLNKVSIKKAIEFLFDVSVIKVNSCNLPKKKRRVGQFTGVRPRYKKVIVKLAKDNKIDLFSIN